MNQSEPLKGDGVQSTGAAGRLAPLPAHAAFFNSRPVGFLQDIPSQVVVLEQLVEMLVNVGGIN